jgi:serine O-acetyltransferase
MDCDLEKITQGLLASYDEVGGINHLDGANLPSVRSIEHLCERLLRLVFPGFLDDGALSEEKLVRGTEALVEEVADRLRQEIRRSLRFCQPPPSALQEAAHRITCDFLRALPEVRRLLQTDVTAAYQGDPAAQSFEEIILSYPCIEAIAIQRLAHCLYVQRVPLVPRMMTEWAHRRTGIDIHPGAQLGSHFFIDHGTGVVIGETACIGQQVKLYHGVTLGAKSFPKDADGQIIKGGQRHPTVEDGVTIYANATILGGETTIGAGSTIGANVFIMESVPPNSSVGLKEENLRIAPKKNPARMPQK